MEWEVYEELRTYSVLEVPRQRFAIFVKSLEVRLFTLFIVIRGQISEPKRLALDLVPHAFECFLDKYVRLARNYEAWIKTKNFLLSPLCTPLL